MKDTSKDTLISQHSIGGKSYKLMLCNSDDNKFSGIACSKCAFEEDSDGCDVGYKHCENSKSYFTESTVYSKGHYNGRGEFVIPIQMIEKAKENKEETKEATALNIQVGGGHYKDMKIQPIEYIHANNLSFLEGNVVKYITRHKTKNKAQDIRKIIHYCTLILQLEYNETYDQE